MSTDFLTTDEGRTLAYSAHKGAADGPTFVWLSGFKSDMQGGKVTALQDWAAGDNVSCLAFDYSGHGQSSGAFEDGTVSAWRADTLAVIDALTDGPLILVGSSMGGWMALLAAMARPDRVAGLVLIAPAPDFTEKLMWPGFSSAAQTEIMETGRTLRPSDYDEPYVITRGLIEDGRRWQVLDTPIGFDGPVRILQGMQDADVPWQHAEKLVDVITSPDLVFTKIKDGDHRLSRDADIARLLTTCREIMSAARGAANC
jgi:pimeloyl-ACP methyl ester carboxylesterase